MDVTSAQVLADAIKYGASDIASAIFWGMLMIAGFKAIFNK